MSKNKNTFIILLLYIKRLKEYFHDLRILKYL